VGDSIGYFFIRFDASIYETEARAKEISALFRFNQVQQL
jgi:hypothetical protein